MRRKLRLGFNARFLRDYNLRGFNRYTVSLLKALKTFDQLEIVLFTDNRSPIHPAFQAALDTEVVTLSSPKVLIWEQAALPVALRRHGIDLFHAPAEGGLPGWKVCPYVLTYLRALDKSLKYWLSTGMLDGKLTDYCEVPRGLRGLYLGSRHRLLRQLYLRSADKVIALSQFGKWELVELLGVPAEKVEVIHLAADETFSADISQESVERARAKYGLPLRYLLFVGSYDPWKNVKGLVRAYAEARKAVALEEGLVLVGIGGDLEGTRAVARETRLLEGRDIIFLERIHEDLPALYKGATAFITLSWGESFCLPIVEAMSCSVPVIASSYGATSEVMADGGVLVDPRNLGEVVEAIRAVTGGEDFRGKLKAQATRRAQAFSWRKTAEQTARLYQVLLARSARTSALSRDQT